MKENKIAWLITHDAYIDRRIFFFADVLQENGWSVKLFPSAYTNFADDKDPEYVVRPMDWSIAKMYGLVLSALQESEREMLEQIIAAQEKHHMVNDCYAQTINGLYGVKAKKGGWKLETYGVGGGYVALLRQGSRCLVYDSHTRHVTVVPNEITAAMAREYEYAIVKADIGKVATDGYTMVGDISVAYMKKGQDTLLAAHCKSNDSSVWAFQDSPAVLYRGLPKPCSPLSAEDFCGQSFDWTLFRKSVCDFSPIEGQVKECLENERPTLVYVADLPTLPIGVMLKRTTGCKLIVDCHEWWYKQEKLWNSGMENRITISEKSEAELYPECDLCITVGKYLAQDMSACYQKNFHVIYSCMSAALRVRPEREPEFWRQYGVPERSRIAIFQGSLTSLRNLDNLARATKYLPEDCYLAVVGGGDYEQEFCRILETEGNPDRVVMVGWVNQGELLRYTVNADLGVLPYAAVDEYFSYSVPNKLMEYFEAQIPILFDASMREISMVAGENHVGIGADLRNPEVFGQTMADLLHDQECLSTLAGNYANCCDMFSYESQKKAFEQMIGELELE